MRVYSSVSTSVTGFKNFGRIRLPISGSNDQNGPLTQLNDSLRGRSKQSEIEGVPPAYSHHDEIGLRLRRVLQNLLMCFSGVDRRFHRCTVLNVLWNHCLKLVQYLTLFRLQV